MEENGEVQAKDAVGQGEMGKRHLETNLKEETTKSATGKRKQNPDCSTTLEKMRGSQEESCVVM